MTAVREARTQPASSRTMDTERLILVPILSGLLVLNVMGTFSYVGTLGSVAAVEALNVLYKALIIGFYALIIALLFVRRSAKDSGRNWLGIAMAYFGSFGPMVLLGVGGVGSAGPLLTLFSVVLMTVGMGFTVYSVAYLGRSFGAVPRARALVTSGPYRRIRHPLYVGEGVAFLGAILIDLSPYKIAVFALLLVVQAYRAVLEERVLSAVFPEYLAYRVRTDRFVPGLV